MSSWVGTSGRPPYVIPRGSAGLKKRCLFQELIPLTRICNQYSKTYSSREKDDKVRQTLNEPNNASIAVVVDFLLSLIALQRSFIFFVSASLF